MKNKKHFLILIIILTSLLTFFKINTIIGEKINYWTWAYAYGSKNDDKANHIILTDDGNYLVFGETFFQNSTDFFLLKIDKRGEILWSKRYTAPKPETGITLGEIIQTKDGGYIFTNTSKSFGKGDQGDIVVIKLDKNGNIEWSKVLLDNEEQGVWGIIQTKDGGFLVGSTGKYLNLFKIHLVKLDSNGNFLWGKRFEYSNHRDVGVFLLEDSKGNILISGRSYKEDYSRPILIKLDKNGNLAWTRIFYLGKSINSGNKIIEAHDDGYVIVGYTNTFGAGDQDLIVFKVDENGDLIWAKTYGSEKYEHAFYISKFDNGYAISSLTNSYRLGYDVLYFTIDKNGDLIWSKRFGGSKDNELDYRYGTIFQTQDKGFILVSFSNSFGKQGYEIVVLKTDNNGNIENCPYIKEAKITIKDIKKSVIVEKPSYSIFNFNWQVKDANFTVSDAGFTRTTIFEVKPTTPKLISPQSGDVIKENLILSWEESINSLNHEIEISEDENFKNVIYKKITNDNKIEIPLDIFKNKTYFWRVRGLNTTNKGDWSEIFNFKIQKVNPPTKPSNIKLEIVDEAIKIFWDFSNQGDFPIEGYEIFRSEDGKDFYSIGAVNKETNYFIDSNIENNKTYFYYVKAFDNQIPKNYSEESEIVSIEIKDDKPPKIIIYSPQENYITNQKTILINGNVSDKLSGVKDLKINGLSINFNPNGDFEKNFDLNEGVNKFIIEAIDRANNKTQKEITIILDTTPPKIDLNLPNETYNEILEITGTVIDEGEAGIKNNQISINNNLINLINNKFSFKLNLSEGINKIVIVLEDNAQNKATYTYEIKYIRKVILKLQIGNKIMLVNGKEQEIDVSPTIIEGRTLLPIRWIAEPLGAKVEWDGLEKKVTITLKNIKIELWIGKNRARVNGIEKLIDPNNPKVVPMVISGRTMLPVRFVAENLGCKVDWDAKTKTVIISYPNE